jgi:predicted amidohydrolase YtcJ
MYNNDAPSDAARSRLARVLRWAAARQLTATFHWNNNRSVDHLLRVIEEVDREHRVQPLRWSIAHLNDASVDSLRRMQALGLGWLVQNAFYFRGEEFKQEHGSAAALELPRITEALRQGVPVGAGTDAHRVMSFNPFVALQWMLDGKTVGGAATRGPDALPTRLQALRLYTEGSAWFARDESRRGALEVGRLADLAVLSGDYLDAPVADLGRLRSLLTMVGGRIVYASDAYAAQEEPTDGRR